MTDLFLDYLNKGGGVMYFLLGTSFVFLHIGIGKMMLYRRYRLAREFAPGLKPQLNFQGDSPIRPKDRLRRAGWFVREYPGVATYRHQEDPFSWESFIREVLHYHVSRLESGLDTMAAWISVAPLLGLLGTVIGMIATFKMITLFGVGDPAIMSEGISVALLTTQAGLMVAFPGLLFLNFLRSRKNALVNELLADGETLLKQRERTA